MYSFLKRLFCYFTIFSIAWSKVSLASLSVIFAELCSRHILVTAAA